MITININLGEAYDRASILRLKSNKQPGNQALVTALADLHVTVERAVEEAKLTVAQTDRLIRLRGDLTRTNEQLWDVEDAIRTASGNDAVAVWARRVIELNDERSKLKAAIDALLSEPGTEVKVYQ